MSSEIDTAETDATVSLIHALINAASVLARRDLAPKPVREALLALRRDGNLREIMVRSEIERVLKEC